MELEVEDSAPLNMVEHLVTFFQQLRRAGLLVSTDRLIDLVRQTDLLDIERPGDFYAITRAAFVSRREDLVPYDVEFRRYWWSLHPAFRPRDAEARTGQAEQSGGVSLPADAPMQSETGAPDAESEDSREAWSRREALAQRDLGSLSESELKQAALLLRELVDALANSAGSRYSPSRRGRQLHMRRIFRDTARAGAAGWLNLFYRKRRLTRTRLIMLCDISGSMQQYSRFLLEMIFAMHRRLAHLQVGVFSTRLTMITELLQRSGPEQALQQIGVGVGHWAGGTDIAESIHQFNRDWGHLTRRRSAVVILSDGWDWGEPEVLSRELARLRSRVGRIVWMNPLLASHGYRPETRGMVAALPHIDDLLPADSIASLGALIPVLRRIER